MQPFFAFLCKYVSQNVQIYKFFKKHCVFNIQAADFFGNNVNKYFFDIRDVLLFFLSFES